MDSHEQFLDFSFGTQVIGILIVKQIRAVDQNAPTYKTTRWLNRLNFSRKIASMSRKPLLLKLSNTNSISQLKQF